MSSHPNGTADQVNSRTDRTHYLYVAVVVAVGLGIAVGFIAPDFAVKLEPIGTAFVNLIKPATPLQHC